MTEPTSWRVEFYQDEHGRRPVEDWLLELGVKDRARVFRTIELLQTYGTQLGLPHCRPLGDKLWELRIQAGRADHRVIYAAVTGKTFILLHSFTKKSQKTPKGELNLAVQRFENYNKRQQ